jgi:FkbM family methyltransferase
MIRLPGLRRPLNWSHLRAAKSRAAQLIRRDTYSLHQLINGVHLAILNRPADPPSLQHWTKVLSRDSGKINELIGLLLTSIRFTNERSQNGEIAKLLSLVLASQVANPIVVDVGAHGADGSNSYDLMRHFGWRGILIEANPALIPRIEQEFAGLNYALVNAAVSNYTGKTTLFLGVSDAISSMHHQATAQWGEIAGSIEVPVKRLPDILQQHDVPNSIGLLSVDAEGEDPNIVNDTIDSGYRPQWIIFEALNPQAIRSFDELPLAGSVKRHYAMAGATYSNMFLRLVTN